MTVTRLIARPMLASMFVVGGINALKNADALAAKAQPVADKVVPLVQRPAPQAPIPTNTTTLVRLNAGAQIVAGRRSRPGDAPRLASAVLAARWCRPPLAGHRFWEETDPAAGATRGSHFFKNVSMFGGLLHRRGRHRGQARAWPGAPAAPRPTSGARRASSPRTPGVRPGSPGPSST